MPQFRVKKNAGSFGSEKMPAISRREICRQFRVGKYGGNFGPEKKNVGKFGPEKKMPVISGRNKMSANSSRKKNAGKFGPKKKMPVFLGGKKFPEKRQLPANLEDCSWIAEGEEEEFRKNRNRFHPWLVYTCTM